MLKNSFSILILIWVLFYTLYTNQFTSLTMISFLTLLLLYLFKLRIIKREKLDLFFSLLILILIYFESSAAYFIAIIGMELIISKKIRIALIVYGYGFLLSYILLDIYLPMILLFSVLFGYLLFEKNQKEATYQNALDNERRMRYDLEITQNALILSKNEIQQFTEIRERNRIAREIHDTVGHNIASVLFQLQAGSKKSEPQSQVHSILEVCIKKLSETLELTREIVFNMRSDMLSGWPKFQKLIQDFHFCEVILNSTGDLNRITPTHWEVIYSNIQEALTNASKHSQATTIHITLAIKTQFIRVTYSDNGVGCPMISPNQGLKGMNERINMIRGTLSYNGDQGFSMIFMIPLSGSED